MAVGVHEMMVEVRWRRRWRHWRELSVETTNSKDAAFY